MDDPAPRGQAATRRAYADRIHKHRAPQDAIFSALTTERRRWLLLQPGEVEPQVLNSSRPNHVVWSSLWPVSPGDTIEFELSTVDDSTALRFRWFSEAPPDDRGIAITRQRLNRKFGADLRAVTSDYYWQSRAADDG